MRRQAARIRKGILLGAGALALPCALGLYAGGAAAGMGLCLALLRLSSPCLPYPNAQKSRANASRLFFAWAVFLFALAAGQAVLSAFSSAYARFPMALPLLRGCLPFPAAALSERAYVPMLPRKTHRALGLMLLTLSILLIVYTR